MTTQPPSAEELVKKWREAAAEEGIVCHPDLHGELSQACDLIERLVKERDDCLIARTDFVIKNSFFIDKTKTEIKSLQEQLRAMTARAGVAEVKLAIARQALTTCGQTHWSDLAKDALEVTK